MGYRVVSKIAGLPWCFVIFVIHPRCFVLQVEHPIVAHFKKLTRCQT